MKHAAAFLYGSKYIGPVFVIYRCIYCLGTPGQSQDMPFPVDGSYLGRILNGRIGKIVSGRFIYLLNICGRCCQKFGILCHLFRFIQLHGFCHKYGCLFFICLPVF